MKKGKILLIMLICFFCSACVDYKSINEKETNRDLDNLFCEMSIGDIDSDGVIEIVSVDGSEIRLLSEKKPIALLKTDNEWKKPYMQVCVIDIDNDDSNEVVITISDESIEEKGRFLSVYIIDKDEYGVYELRSFPMEIDSGGRCSGVEVSVVPRENYMYEVKCLEHSFLIDATRIYGLSRLNAENIRKAQDEWNSYIERGRQGKALGIVSVEIFTTEAGSNYMRIYEVIKGADKDNIGNIAVEIEFLPDGTYEVLNIEFLQRTDVQP